MTLCTYLPPVAVHSDRIGGHRQMPPKLIVVHTSEQTVEGPNAARDLAAYITRPGDRTTSSGSRYGSSYHDVVDVGRVVRPCVPHDRVAFSAPGANTDGLHVCLPGRAGQDLAGWSDGYSAALIDTLAAYIVDQATRYGIPMLELPVGVVELQRGSVGVTDHYRIGRAFGRTNHTDVGVSFPWDRLADLIHQHTNPDPEEDDTMSQGIVAKYVPMKALQDAGHRKVFGLLPDGNVRHLSGPDAELERPTVPIRGLEHYQQCEELDAVWRSRS
jgi:N-acetyl-anhydromuramyl-L-alanine amidase AmpD